MLFPYLVVSKNAAIKSCWFVWASIIKSEGREGVVLTLAFLPPQNVFLHYKVYKVQSKIINNNYIPPAVHYHL